MILNKQRSKADYSNGCIRIYTHTQWLHLICLHCEFVLLPVLLWCSPSLSFSLLCHPKAKGLICYFFISVFAHLHGRRDREQNPRMEKRAMRNKSIYAHNQKKIHIACTLIYDIKCNNFEVFLLCFVFFCLFV